MYSKRPLGFTMVELMITIAVLAILLGLATPSMQAMIARNRMAAESNALSADIAMARQEASRRGITVTICPAAITRNSNALGAVNCSGSDWNTGRIMFVDNPPLGAVENAADILRTREATNGVVIAPDVANFGLRVSPSGTVSNALNFTVCKGGQMPRMVSVALSGRVTTSEGTTACAY